MNYKLKRIMSLMIAVFVAFGMMAAGTGEASAATAKVKVEINNQVDKANTIYKGEQTYVSAYPTKGKKLVTIKSIKVADTSIAKAKVTTIKYKGKKYHEYYVVGKKPGKTTVSVKYKYNGKVSTKKVKVTVLPYPNPLKSLTVNGKKISLKGDKSFIYQAKCKKTKVKIKAAAAKGWEITYVDSYSYYGSGKKLKFKDVSKAKSKVKKGTSISFPKKHKGLNTCIYLQNEEGDSVFYEVVLKR